MVEAAWEQAKRLFPPRSAVAPEVVFAPSVEIFRQMTSQPGWMLASTSGGRIVLQPESVLGGREHSVLLHEMLHALVESEASAKAPLWLREGLVEVLAGESESRDNGDGTMDDAATENALRHAGTRELSERAHWAAAARVRGLISRYGMAQVRSWLGSGAPAGTG